MEDEQNTLIQEESENKNEDVVHEKIEKSLKTSEKIDKIVKKIYKTVELTKMSATDEFKVFTEPKKNLDDLANFYDTFIECDDEYNRIKEANLKIKDIESVLVNLEEVEALFSIKQKLEVYDKIIIVKILLKENEQIFKSLMKSIENVFFRNLGVNKDTQKLNQIATFLMDKEDSKVFLSRYSNELYNKVSFSKIQFDRALLLKETSNIDKFIYDLNFYNTEILGEKNALSLNVGLNKILIINLKKVISENLQLVEKEDKVDHVPFLIELNNNLKHTNPQIKEVEDLFVYKDPINKIICNIFITFTDQVERLDRPNKFCDVESLTLVLRRALDSMNNYKIVTKVFIKNYGPMFKIQTLDECNEKFTTMLIEKIFKLADSLSELKKCIYLVNNLYALQNYIKEPEKIEFYSNKIIDTFKVELNKRNAEKLTNFIDDNIVVLKSYYLPDDVRIKVVSLMKKIIWEEIGKKEYRGELDKLNTNINDMFIGK